MFRSGGGNDSALYLASTARDPETADLLIEHGANTNIYGGHCDNPLQVASENGDIAIIRILLKAGSDVNRKGGIYGTALTAACCLGSAGVVKLLLEHNADPNIQGCWEDDNALQAACQMNNAEITLLLLENGAYPNLQGGRYGSALHAAFSKGNEVIIRELLKRGADFNYKGGEYYSVLQAAVDSGKEEAVQIALECDLSPNEKGGWFTYPLLRAAAFETCPDSIVRLLLEAGADPNLEREGDGSTGQTFRTALQHVSSPSKATLLLDNGAKVNTVSGWLGTALHTIIFGRGNRKSAMIKLLLDRGADVNKKAEHIGPPLWLAGREADLKSARILIQAGADLDSVNVSGHSALHMAICNSKPGEELFDYLVSLGSDPLVSDRRKCNGLHYAARANNVVAIEKILERGPDVNSVDSFGWTPLHWAAASTRVSTQVIKALVLKKCNIEMKDRDGRTALDLAMMFDNSESVAILKNLFKPDIDQLEDGVTIDEKPHSRLCDGCLIVRTLSTDNDSDAENSSS